MGDGEKPQNVSTQQDKAQGCASAIVVGAVAVSLLIGWVADDWWAVPKWVFGIESEESGEPANPCERDKYQAEMQCKDHIEGATDGLVDFRDVDPGNGHKVDGECNYSVTGKLALPNKRYVDFECEVRQRSDGTWARSVVEAPYEEME